ncbi:MAG: hypothetical protein ABIJ34_04040 [archaeon]
MFSYAQMIKRPSETQLTSTVDSLRRLAELAYESEQQIQQRWGRPFTALQASNIIVHEKWGRWKNRDVASSQAPQTEFDRDVTRIFHSNGLCDIPRFTMDAKVELSPDLNNTYVSISIMFGANAAFFVNPPTFNIHNFGVFLFSNSPGIGINPRYNSFTDRAVSYIGENYREKVARALAYSYLGEVYQNQIGQSHLQELRSNAYGLIKMEDHLKRLGADGFHSLLFSTLLVEYAGDMPYFSEKLSEHPDLKDFFLHIQDEEYTFWGSLSQKVVGGLVNMVESHPSLEMVPLLGAVGRNLCSTSKAEAYDNLYKN